MSATEIAALIQHTNVKPDATRGNIERLLGECVEHGFDGAMVAPIWVADAFKSVAGTGIKVCTAFDYPMGGDTTETVARGVMDALSRGAAEVDVMTKVGWLKSGMDADYREHLAGIVAAAEGAPVKAMLEVALLSDEELVRAVDLCVDAGVTYIKNSSGYGGGNATPETVRRLVRLADGRVRVKASGGIKTLDQAMALVAAGASLLGASGSVGIVTSGSGAGDY